MDWIELWETERVDSSNRSAVISAGSCSGSLTSCFGSGTMTGCSSTSVSDSATDTIDGDVGTGGGSLRACVRDWIRDLRCCSLS